MAFRVENWVKRGMRPGLGSRDIRRIFWETVNFGPHFLREFADRQSVRGGTKLSSTLATFEAPFTLQNLDNSVKVSLSFAFRGKTRIVKIEGIQGRPARAVGREEFAKVFREVISIAKSSGYNSVYLVKPERNPYYDKDENELIALMSQKQSGKKSGSEESPLRKTTLFELREILEGHQERMRKLYYGIATAFKFNRKTRGKYMELKI